MKTADEEELDAIYDREDEDKALKNLLWKRIMLNADEYADDFRQKRDRISALANKRGIAPAKKKVLMSILEND